MKRLLAAIIFVMSVSHALSAQTLTPIISEYGKKAAGSFTIQSNVLIPMSVTLEAYSFTLDKDGKHMQKLLPSTHVKLSETSTRLSPKETHEFTYKITCDVLPCNVSILSGMVVGHTQGDDTHPAMQVRLILDHTVYVCQKQKDCRAGIIAASGYRTPEQRERQKQVTEVSKPNVAPAN